MRPRTPPKSLIGPRLFGAVGLSSAVVLLAASGCSDQSLKQAYLHWWKAGSSAAPTNVHADSTHQTPPASDEDSTDKADVTTDSEEHQNQAESKALKEAKRAEIAAAAAKKASEEALEASKHASEAAAMLKNANSPSGPNTPGSSTPGAVKTDTAAVPAAGSKLTLASTNSGMEENPTRIAALLQKLEDSLSKIDRSKLDSEVAKRTDLAERLLESARKALAQNNYSQANSLAVKASVIMAPLTGNAPETAPNP